MSQLGLSFSAPAPAPLPAPVAAPGADASLEERFRAFHEANPSVYEELRDLALAGRRRGLRRLGIGALFEVLRWNRMMSTVGDPDFKLNNNHRAYYARELMQREPRLAGIFETRALHDEDP